MTALTSFYSNLGKIREEFHKFGRFNDSNSKLDEISKLMCIYIDAASSQSKLNKLNSLLTSFKHDESFPLVDKLKEQFAISRNSRLFKLENGSSIFEDDSELRIGVDDNRFAFSLLNLIIEPLTLASRENAFDIINESFGHFVRDNFRNNIEDAQYMTPYEVVDAICEMAISNVGDLLQRRDGDFVVMDPCCGVGSFLNTFLDCVKIKYPQVNHSKLKIVGQDKVPRMLRLTKLNLSVNHPHNNFINSGNSLVGKSFIDKYIGKVDLILTNPPFGAKFSQFDFESFDKRKYPLLFDYFSRTRSINSEILFIDMCIALLKEDGELFAIVPDSVISSQGVASVLRHRILENDSIQVKSIVELPTVAFAQAGTRTKTSILHLKKKKKGANGLGVFIAQSESIGFDVSVRKGATIKVVKGENDLPSIVAAFKKGKEIKKTSEIKIISSAPSGIIVPYVQFAENSWTPNHYNTKKIGAFGSANFKEQKFDLIELGELVKSVTKERRKLPIENGSKCISILHIVNNDILDYAELLNYNPIYAGTPVKAGDLIFSKLNPRIPRSLIVPHLPFQMTCSNEFEILDSISKFSNFAIKSLLFLPQVQLQIRHLTSGTSSSHNRIKTQDLLSVKLPVPRINTKKYLDFMNFMTSFEQKSLLFQKNCIERVHLTEKIQLFFDV